MKKYYDLETVEGLIQKLKDMNELRGDVLNIVSMYPLSQYRLQVEGYGKQTLWEQELELMGLPVLQIVPHVLDGESRIIVDLGFPEDERYNHKECLQAAGWIPDHE